MNDLINSYKKCLSGMDLDIVQPFHETELQPLYSNIWIKYIIKMVSRFSVDHIDQIIALLLNRSIIRSMLIMDLLDCHYTKINPVIKEKIKNFYNIIINKIYKEDPFSLYSNRPYNNVKKDYNFFIQKEQEYYIKQILHQCFLYSYLKYQDIYADNCYEIIGPYKNRDYTFVLNNFYISDLKNDINIVNIFDNIYNPKGYIDLFGHCTIIADKNPEYVIEINNKIVTNVTELKSLYKKIYEIVNKYMNINYTEYELKKMNFDNRYSRYEKLFNFYNITVDKDKIYERLNYSKCNRVVFIDQLISMIN